MAKKYTRKHLANLDQLDLEQERIRNKSKVIQNDFLDILNPQQLAITFLGNVLSRKMKGSKKEKVNKNKGTASGSYVYANNAQSKLKEVVQHPLFKKMLKKVGMSFLKWQAFNLALFAGKKIYYTLKEKKRLKEQKLLPAPAVQKRKILGS